MRLACLYLRTLHNGIEKLRESSYICTWKGGFMSYASELRDCDGDLIRHYFATDRLQTTPYKAVAAL